MAAVTCRLRCLSRACRFSVSDRLTGCSSRGGPRKREEMGVRERREGMGVREGDVAADHSDTTCDLTARSRDRQLIVLPGTVLG